MYTVSYTNAWELCTSQIDDLLLIHSLRSIKNRDEGKKGGEKDNRLKDATKKNEERRMEERGGKVLHKSM